MIKFDDFLNETSVSTKKEREPLKDAFLRSLYSDKEWVESIAEEVKKISGSDFKLLMDTAEDIDMYYADPNSEWPTGDVWKADFEVGEIKDNRRNMEGPMLYIVSRDKARQLVNEINKHSIHLGGEVRFEERTRAMYPYEMLNFLNRNGWRKPQIAEKWYKPHRGWQLVGQLGI